MHGGKRRTRLVSSVTSSSDHKKLVFEPRELQIKVSTSYPSPVNQIPSLLQYYIHPIGPTKNHHRLKERMMFKSCEDEMEGKRGSKNKVGLDPNFLTHYNGAEPTDSSTVPRGELQRGWRGRSRHSTCPSTNSLGSFMLEMNSASVCKTLHSLQDYSMSDTSSIEILRGLMNVSFELTTELP